MLNADRINVIQPAYLKESHYVDFNITQKDTLYL